MKKLIYAVLIAFMLCLPLPAVAEEKTLTFAWDEPTDLELITEWKIFWGETSGGPYTEIAVVPKNDTFQAPATMDVRGPAGSTQTRYFVMIACGDLPDGYKCSADSNEISYDFEIPYPTDFVVPLNFRILPE